MIVTWSEWASAVKTRPVCSSRPMSIGSLPVWISRITSCVSRSTTETKSLREHATNARRRSTSTAIPSGSRPTGISAICRHGERESIRHAAPTGDAGSSLSPVAASCPASIASWESRRQGNARAVASIGPPVADAVLIYADSLRSADMRHAVPLGVPDPFLYAEQNGSRYVFANSMEATRLRELGLFDVHVHEEFGIDALIEAGLPRREIAAQLALRSVQSLGPKRFAVPDEFPVWLADRLRADGLELEVDQELFDDRRRA